MKEKPWDWSQTEVEAWYHVVGLDERIVVAIGEGEALRQWRTTSLSPGDNLHV